MKGAELVHRRMPSLLQRLVGHVLGSIPRLQKRIRSHHPAVDAHRFVPAWLSGWVNDRVASSTQIAQQHTYDTPYRESTSCCPAKKILPIIEISPSRCLDCSCLRQATPTTIRRLMEETQQTEQSIGAAIFLELRGDGSRAKSCKLSARSQPQVQHTALRLPPESHICARFVQIICDNKPAQCSFPDERWIAALAFFPG